MTTWSTYGSEFVPEAQEGWSWPLRLDQAHYFHRRLSLCGLAELIEHDGEPDRIDRRRLNRCESCETRLRTLERYRRGERPTTRRFG